MKWFLDYFFFYRCKCPGHCSLTEAPILLRYSTLINLLLRLLFLFMFFFVRGFWLSLTVHLFSYFPSPCNSLNLRRCLMLLPFSFTRFSASGNGLHRYGNCSVNRIGNQQTFPLNVGLTGSNTGCF